MELKDLRLLGGKLCIDYANSFDNVAPGERLDFITSYAWLLRWCRHVGLTDEHDALALDELARADPDAASRVYERAIELRAALRGVLHAVAEQRPAPPDALQAVQAEYRRALDAITLTPNGNRYQWDAHSTYPRLDQILWPITLSALDLLMRDDLRRVKLCASHGCGWLFYDQSKNRSRRWCSMEGCGSEEKLRRHYRKRKAAAQQGSS